MSDSNQIATPGHGKIITARQGRYVVSEALPSTLIPSPLGGRTTPQHLVTLNSIEDCQLDPWCGRCRCPGLPCS